MASPNSTFTELVTTTLRNHPKTIYDNVSNHNAFMRRIMERNNYDTLSGGTEIVQNLEYAENSTYQRYSGYDTLNQQASDVFSAANFAWRNMAINVTASGDVIRMNAGSTTQIADLVKARIKNAITSFGNGFAEDLYSDGTATGQINGLQALVADAGTGTVGGINSSTFTWWKNIVQSAAAPLQGGGAITPSATTIESLMLHLWLALTRGTDSPDLILASNDYYAFFETSQTSIKRYADSKLADAGFTALKYKSADVVHDSSASGMPSAHMYFLNTKYLRLKVHKDANMTQLAERTPINQDAVVIPIIMMGNLTVANRALQGVLKA